MTRLASLASAYRRPPTSAELRSRIGQPLSPCPACGSSIYSILLDAFLVCAGCDWDLATGPQCAIPVVVLLDADGTSRAYDRHAALQTLQEARRIDAAAYWLPVADSGQSVRVMPSRPPRGRECPAGMLLDEWFGQLPVLTSEFCEVREPTEPAS